jgi:hypothetical protein
MLALWGRAKEPNFSYLVSSLTYGPICRNISGTTSNQPKSLAQQTFSTNNLVNLNLGGRCSVVIHSDIIAI